MTADVHVTVGLPAQLYPAAGEDVRTAVVETISGLLSDLDAPGRPRLVLEMADSLRIRVRGRALPVSVSAVARALAYVEGVPATVPSIDSVSMPADRLGELVSLLCREAVSSQLGVLLPPGPSRAAVELGLPPNDKLAFSWGRLDSEDSSERTGSLEISAEPGHLRAVTEAAAFRRGISSMIDALHAELGLVLPPMTLRPDPSLRPRGYAFRIQKVPTLPRIGPLDDDEAATDLLTTLAGALRQRAYAFLTPARVVAMVSKLALKQPALCESTEAHLDPLLVTRILRDLLADGLPVRNLPGILDDLLRHATEAMDGDPMDFVRPRLIDSVVARVGGARDGFTAFRLDPAWAETITALSSAPPDDVPDEIAERLRDVVRETLRPWLPGPATLVVPDGIRRTVRTMLRPEFPELLVLGYDEIPARYDVRWLDTITA